MADCLSAIPHTASEKKELAFSDTIAHAANEKP